MLSFVRAGLLVHALLVLSALCATTALAQPGSGPRQTVDQTYTTTAPNAPTGLGYSATYHAAGDESAPPPYMRRMVFRPPPGFTIDTSVPDHCTATDAELQALGPAACPPGSVLGEGTTDGLFMAPVTNSFVFHEYTHPVYIVNNASEQIILVESEGFTVIRGKVGPDSSIDVTPPTCFPSPPTGQCADDYILQTATSTFVAPYTKTIGDSVRSYATTPPECPKQGYWSTTISFEWADGASDDVVTTQPCSKRAGRR